MKRVVVNLCVIESLNTGKAFAVIRLVGVFAGRFICKYFWLIDG